MEDADNLLKEFQKNNQKIQQTIEEVTISESKLDDKIKKLKDV